MDVKQQVAEENEHTARLAIRTALCIGNAGAVPPGKHRKHSLFGQCCRFRINEKDLVQWTCMNVRKSNQIKLKKLVLNCKLTAIQ